MTEELREELNQDGYNIGYNMAEELSTMLDDLSTEEKAIAIKGFIEGFDFWEIDEIKITGFFLKKG
jgi:hypothetical protein